MNSFQCRPLRDFCRAALLAAVFSLTASLSAQSARDAPSSVTPSGSASGAGLPLSSVTLYSGGVGYFIREGAVVGNQNLEFAFRAAQVNDLLKSLTLRDLDGGSIGGVSYGSQDSADRRLASFAVNLAGNPSLAAMLTGLRGERIRLSLPENLEGLLVGVETATDDLGYATHALNILTESGLRSALLKDLRSIAFVNPRIDEEFRKALAVLAESRDEGRTLLRVNFSGSGRRRVFMGYLAEAPIWKTSYRLVLGPEAQHYLQGWAIVENASDDDWVDVDLSLASGRPISFVMDLATPRYAIRPVVRPSVSAGPAPRTYEDSLSAAPSAPSAALAPKAAAPAKRESARLSAEYESPAPAALGDEAPYGQAYGAGPESYGAGVEAAAVLESEGSLVRYRISEPVSLKRRESAMFPFAEGTVSGRRVSVYDQSVEAKRPLLGLELVNDTPNTLLAGPLTLFDGVSYAGDALLDDLLPGSERLLTYSVDLETEVAPEGPSQAETIRAMTLSKGIFTLTKSLVRRSSYTVKNSASTPKELIIERPYDPAWTLIAPALPSGPVKQSAPMGQSAPAMQAAPLAAGTASAQAERTRSGLRFRLSVGAKATETLAVAEERTLLQTYGLLNLSDAQLVLYASEGTASPAVKAAFVNLREKRSAIQATVSDRQEAERKLRQIKDEQSRIRSNMGSLSSNSDLYKRYAATLAEQEKDIAELLQRIDALYEREKSLNADLNNYVMGLELK